MTTWTLEKATSGVMESDSVTQMMPMKEMSRPSSLLELTDSTCRMAPMKRVKKEEVDERMVWDATDVYESDALVEKLATNHSAQKTPLSLAVSRSVRGSCDWLFPGSSAVRSLSSAATSFSSSSSSKETAMLSSSSVSSLCSTFLMPIGTRYSTNEETFRYVIKNGFLYPFSSNTWFSRNEDETHDRITTRIISRPMAHFFVYPDIAM